MTRELFRTDSFAKSCTARVTALSNGGIVLDTTVFYPQGGGQPGDTGQLTLPDSGIVEITGTIRDGDSGELVHVVDSGVGALSVGDAVTVHLNWERRFAHMRMHSALHLLCAVIEGGVTGGQVGAEKSRLDFDLPDTTLDKDQITAALNRLIAGDHPITYRSISDEELAAEPDLVRTMSVKPPTGLGSVRVIEIDGVDLQPCGGTHVATTSQIGALRVGKIENKGKHNRRVNIHFAD